MEPGGIESPSFRGSSFQSGDLEAVRAVRADPTLFLLVQSWATQSSQVKHGVSPSSWYKRTAIGRDESLPSSFVGSLFFVGRRFGTMFSYSTF